VKKLPGLTPAAFCLTAKHVQRMVSRMKTTLTINDEMMGRLREEAAKRKKNISEPGNPCALKPSLGCRRQYFE
jgi:hypothetical protein